MENQMDMFKMMEQAMTLKSMMSTGNEVQTENNQMNNMKNMMQMMEMMNLFSNNNSNSTENKHETEVFFDEPIFNSDLKTLKASIPYLKGQQKNMAILVKLIELKKVQEMYNNNKINAMSEEDNEDLHIKMLSNIKQYMSEEKRHVVDTFLKLLEAKEMMKSNNNNI